MARKRTLSEQISSVGPLVTGTATIPGATTARPPNVSQTKTGSTKPKPKRKSYLKGVQQNYANDALRTNPKTDEQFRTFTRPDKPGMTYHEYEDPKTGKRRVVGLKKRTGPPKGHQVPIGG